MKIPNSLFKYCSFNTRLIEQLCWDCTYYTDPAYFNDPLDCSPTIEPDLSLLDLRQLLELMIERRLIKDLRMHSRKFHSLDEKIKSSIKNSRKDVANNAVSSYMAQLEHLEEYDPIFCLQIGIEKELRNIFKEGALCLSSRFNSPLMWSHYADQHKGVCIEYDTSAPFNPEELRKITYGRSRSVPSSQILAWLKSDCQIARNAIYQASLFTKSREWRYESEWRLFRPIGLEQSQLKLKSVIFGIKCPAPVKYTIIKTLDGREKPIKFWEIIKPNKNFELSRKQVDREEFLSGVPAMSGFYDFDKLVNDLQLDHAVRPTLKSR